jgi:hypothetical protein
MRSSDIAFLVVNAHFDPLTPTRHGYQASSH